jgi:hypothetical protein
MDRITPSRLQALAAALLLALGSPARAADALQNWFGDPFFQVTAALPDCPLPAGPFTDEADRRVQAHRRLEKGTTCWLAKECDRPNAYAYDADIASAIRSAFNPPPGERPPFADTTLWVTVQGRVVYVEGCARDAADAIRIETFVRALPHVQQATAILRTDPTARPPYKTRPATLAP